MKSRCLSIFVIIGLIIGIFPNSVFSADNIISLTQSDLQNSAYTLSSGSYKLEENTEVEGSLVISKNQTVTLDLNGYILSQKSGTQASVIFMEENSALTLNDSRPTSSNTGLNGGYITDGTTADDDINEDLSGGGIYVSSGAELTMNAGTIYCCEAYCAGGIYIAGGGKAVMNGGKIYGCVAKVGLNVGGIYVSENAQFEMNGGTVSYCFTAIHYGTLGMVEAVGVNNNGIMKISGEAVIDYGYEYNVDAGSQNASLARGLMNNGKLYANGGTVYGFSNSKNCIVDSESDEETYFYNSEDIFFGGPIYNLGIIKAGRFKHRLTNSGTISGGTFYEEVVNGPREGYGEVFGGTFLGKTENIYTVTFNTNGGSTAPEKQMRANVSATRPDKPSKYGYLFAGWYNGDKKHDFTENITEDITLTAKWVEPECFSLDVGDTYYFDLSNETFPGEINDGSHLEIGEYLPDATLHYVPFTYAGTVESYALKDELSEDYAEEARSLFVADANINVLVSWNELNESGLIFGKEYTSGNISYTMRSPSGGNSSTGSGNDMSGLPEYNDWDTVLSKNPDYIKTLNPLASFSQMLLYTQDKSTASSDSIILRGKSFYGNLKKWSEVRKTAKFDNVGYRPLLELPTNLGKNDIKTVTLDLNGGNVNSEEIIKIAVSATKAFSAPTCKGITAPKESDNVYFCWIDENGGIYLPGDSVPNSVNKLTARWFEKDKPDVVITKTDYYAAGDTGKLYIAAYNGERLTDAIVTDVGKVCKTADAGLDTSGADSIKAFVWSEDCVPLCRFAEITLDGE